MTKLRELCTGPWPVHFCQKGAGTLAALLIAAMPVNAAHAEAASSAAVAAAPKAQPGGQSVADF